MFDCFLFIILCKSHFVVYIESGLCVSRVGLNWSDVFGILSCSNIGLLLKTWPDSLHIECGRSPGFVQKFLVGVLIDPRVGTWFGFTNLGTRKANWLVANEIHSSRKFPEGLI